MHVNQKKSLMIYFVLFHLVFLNMCYVNNSKKLLTMTKPL